MDEKQHIWSLVAKKLSGEEMSEEEATELEKLLREQHEWQYTYEMLLAYWPASKEYLLNKEVPEERMNSLSARIGIPKGISLPEGEEIQEIEVLPWEINRRKHTGWEKWLIAATVLLIVTTGFLLNHYASIPIAANSNNHTGNGESEITTRYGSKTKVTLPDGTNVWINSGSKLVYNNKNFGVNNRELTLVGEGFFDVAHDASLPFIIHAGKINIKVLGTAFDVKSYPEDKTTETTLIRGSIEIGFANNSHKKILLKPHQKLTVYNDDRLITQNLGLKDTKSKGYKIAPMTILPSSDSTVVETSWVQDKLAFRSEAFSRLAIQMERWYDVKINFTDSEVKKYEFTGVFVNESLEQALKALQITAPFQYRIHGEDVYISKPK